MVIFASEDIGLAGNGALSLAIATFEAVERVGLPEAKYNLFHCAIALARSQKSREITDLMHGAFELARKYPNSPVPFTISGMLRTKIDERFGTITRTTNGKLALSMTKDFYQRKLRMWYN